jgi:hypothetical protein
MATAWLGPSGCRACDQGRFSAVDHLAGCVLCPVGKHQPNRGQADCHLCKLGVASCGKGVCSPGSVWNVTSCSACPTGQSVDNQLLLYGKLRCKPKSASKPRSKWPFVEQLPTLLLNSCKPPPVQQQHRSRRRMPQRRHPFLPRKPHCMQASARRRCSESQHTRPLPSRPFTGAQATGRLPVLLMMMMRAKPPAGRPPSARHYTRRRPARVQRRVRRTQRKPRRLHPRPAPPASLRPFRILTLRPHGRPRDLQAHRRPNGFSLAPSATTKSPT